MNRTSTRKIVLAGIFIAIGYLLPYLTGQVPQIGNRLLPMHFPVLLAGFICGGPYGLAVGAILPLFRSLTTTMPPMFPVAIAMAFEMGAYGLLCGLLYAKLPKKPLYVIVSLIVAMIVGRIVWGAAMYVLIAIDGGAFAWQAFISGAVLNAIPGIVGQIVLVPIIVLSLRRATLIE